MAQLVFRMDPPVLEFEFSRSGFPRYRMLPPVLACALSVEAAELLEPFQWLNPDQSASLDAPTLAHVREEMADVLNYLVRLADKLDVNLLEAARDKIRKNAPVWSHLRP